MKKVINITLGGIVFAIEQDAFEVLESYLSQIKNNLNNSDDAKEVIEDIESAIAEKFIAQKRNEKLAVTIFDINQVMREMGDPADFGDDEVVAENEKSTPQDSSVKTQKRLYRDVEDSIIAGVSSGLAKYFDIDPVIIRLLFVISIFFNGLGVLAYLILWLVIPAAKTTADKYAMRGERLTLKDISERVKKNLHSIDDADLEMARGAWTKVRDLLNKIFEIIGVVIKAIFVLLRYLIGIALVIGGTLGVAGLVSLYSVILLSEKTFFPQGLQTVLDMMLSSTIGIAAMVSSFIMLSIPLVVLTIGGASVLLRRNFFTLQKTIILAIIWMAAFVIAGTTIFLQVEQIIQKIDSEEWEFNDQNREVQWEGGVIYEEGQINTLRSGGNIGE